MRGNPGKKQCGAVIGRSIPAYAGEPNAPPQCGHPPGVYPRVCGGTEQAGAAAAGEMGLSPRMRGNPGDSDGNWSDWRSIPAYAGEPHCGAAEPGRQWVYPRVCGGTPIRRRFSRRRKGLSPRMRGNLRRRRHTGRRRGSIPAYAGEPLTRKQSGLYMGVYPRVCGGTAFVRPPPSPIAGLSPRMRGNLITVAMLAENAGSIPAYAGEPYEGKILDGLHRVYPRVCGGTEALPTTPIDERGLSPRMRGNPVQGWGPACRTGSIPAYAGEPARDSRRRLARWVYPRVCGGTGAATGRRRRCGGLSPRMRGNPSCPAHRAARRRSIPAYAGEPLCRPR